MKPEEKLLFDEVLTPMRALTVEASNALEAFSAEREEGLLLCEKNSDIYDKKSLPVHRFYQSVLTECENLKDTQIGIFLREFGLDPSHNARQEIWRIYYFIQNYSFAKRNISGAIRNFEGSACSVDKFSTLLKSYLTVELQIRKGARELPLFPSPVNEKNAWAFVQEESLSLWFQYLDSLPHLNSGQGEIYVEAYKNLEKFYKPEQF